MDGCGLALWQQHKAAKRIDCAELGGKSAVRLCRAAGFVINREKYSH
jgi:hypothetical protein